jgi:hypothetical protein
MKIFLNVLKISKVAAAHLAPTSLLNTPLIDTPI